MSDSSVLRSGIQYVFLILVDCKFHIESSCYPFNNRNSLNPKNKSQPNFVQLPPIRFFSSLSFQHNLVLAPKRARIYIRKSAVTIAEFFIIFRIMLQAAILFLAHKRSAKQLKKSLYGDN